MGIGNHHTLLLFFLLTTISVLMHGCVGIPGGWSPIKDIKDPHIQELGKYAVTEHNKEAKAALEFQQVVSGETQVVAGMNYKLIISAKDASQVSNYQAVVWEKSWLNFRQLTSFKPVK
ncbi:cystatin-C protein [Dioscorea alata]|uniref:Cystatin-C protein n=1 Tax=Dioscorea alata TaxID=55571 RepID=A0ACB7U0F1_DIOAL|nr:cystatin-C protein [Dioscorea alata]